MLMCPEYTSAEIKRELLAGRTAPSPGASRHALPTERAGTFRLAPWATGHRSGSKTASGEIMVRCWALWGARTDEDEKLSRWVLCWPACCWRAVLVRWP